MTGKIAILDAALYLADKHGLHSLDRARIASQAGVSTGAVSQAFGDMEKLRDRVVAEAIRERKLRVVGQAIAAGHPRTGRLSPAVRREALESLV